MTTPCPFVHHARRKKAPQNASILCTNLVRLSKKGNRVLHVGASPLPPAPWLTQLMFSTAQSKKKGLSLHLIQPTSFTDESRNVTRGALRVTTAVFPESRTNVRTKTRGKGMQTRVKTSSVAKSSQWMLLLPLISTLPPTNHAICPRTSHVWFPLIYRNCTHWSRHS